MSDTHHAAINQRISVLERSNRRLRIAVIAGVLGLVGLGFAGFANQPASRREVQTQNLVIVGDDGKPRARMAALDDGSSFFLYGPDAYQSVSGGGGAGGQGVGGFMVLKPRIRFMVDGESARAEFLDPDGQARMKLLLSADGPAVQMLDEEGNEIDD